MDNLQTQIDNLKTLQESYDAVAQAAEAYNTGKVELAANITSKGVQASANETLPELAGKVAAISQESYTINGGEMYAKQLFGSLETPNYWNLYEVLANLLSDGRLVNYGGILLAEYYRGYDSLALSGAGTGGAYVVSDLNENGQFKIYTEDTTHTWATEFDGKGNRWVAYCFADEHHDFQITDTNTSPRSIFIGRKVGIIEQLVASRHECIVLPYGGELRRLKPNGYAANYGKMVTASVFELMGGEFVLGSSTESAYIACDEFNASEQYKQIFANNGGLKNLVLSIKKIGNTVGAIFQRYTSISTIILTGIESCDSALTLGSSNRDYDFLTAPNLTSIIICQSEQLSLNFTLNSNPSDMPNLKYIYIGYKSNDKTKSIGFNLGAIPYGGRYTPYVDIELQNGWCKPVNLAYFSGQTEVNMYAHILQRLKQDEPDCGDGVTITLGATNLAKLTSEESQDLLALLRGTYGYTFA